MGEHVFLLTALPLWAFDRTHSARTVSLALLAVITPALFSLPAGAWTTRFPTPTVLSGCGLLRLILTGILFLPAFHTLEMTLGIVFLISLVDSFFMPALKAALPAWASVDGLLEATSWLEATDIPAELFGPLIGVLLYQRWGLSGAVAAQFLAYGASFIILLIGGGVPVPGQNGKGPPPAFFAELGQLLRRAWLSFNIRQTLVAWTAGMSAAGMGQALMLPFIHSVLHQPESIFGVFGAALGLGMALGAVISAFYEPELPPIALLAISATTLTAAFAAFTQGRSVPMCGIALLVAGIGLVWVHISVNTLLLTELPEGDRAGVLGLTHTIEATGLLMGLALGGNLAERWGVIPTLDAALGMLLVAWVIAVHAALSNRKSGQETRDNPAD